MGRLPFCRIVCDSPEIIVFIVSLSSSRESPSLTSLCDAWQPGMASMDRSRCSVPTWSWPRLAAHGEAAFKASTAFFVNWMFI